MTKECFTCHETKPVSEFTLRKPGGALRSSCKVCWNRRERLRNNSDKEKKRVSAVKEMEAIGRNPYGFLAAGIIELAIREYRNWRDGNRKKMETDYKTARFMARELGYANPVEEIEAFFASDWFEELAGYADCDAEYLRKHILEKDEFAK